MEENCYMQKIGANAFCLNKQADKLITAGRSAFKLLSICQHEDQSYRLVEVADMISRKHRPFGHDVTDVAWSQAADTSVAISFAGPNILIYDVNVAAEASSVRLTKHIEGIHQRPVHRIHFHPADANILVTGSQDGACVLLDVRKVTTAQTFQVQDESGVRDVEFHPSMSYRFASASDSGLLAIWDSRRNDKPEILFTAHTDPILSLDWHLEQKHIIATASRDKLIKVWDISKETDLCVNTVFAPYGLARVKWRKENPYHFASCSFLMDSSIAIWDVRRPHIPFAIFHHHCNPIAEMVWCDKNAIISCGKKDNIYIASMNQAVDTEQALSGSAMDVGMINRLAKYVAQRPGNLYLDTAYFSPPKQFMISTTVSPLLSDDPVCMELVPVDKMGLSSRYPEHTINRQSFVVDDPMRNFDADFCLLYNFNPLLDSRRSLEELCIRNAEIAGRICPLIERFWRILPHIVTLIAISEKRQPKSQAQIKALALSLKTICSSPCLATDNSPPLSDFIWRESLSGGNESITSVQMTSTASEIASSATTSHGSRECSRTMDLLKRPPQLSYRFKVRRREYRNPMCDQLTVAEKLKSMLRKAHRVTLTTNTMDSGGRLQNNSIDRNSIRDSGDYIQIPWDSTPPSNPRQFEIGEFTEMDFRTEEVTFSENFPTTHHQPQLGGKLRKNNSNVPNLAEPGERSKVSAVFNTAIPASVFYQYLCNRIVSFTDDGHLATAANIILTLGLKNQDLAKKLTELIYVKDYLTSYLQMLLKFNMYCKVREIVNFSNCSQYLDQTSALPKSPVSPSIRLARKSIDGINSCGSNPSVTPDKQRFSDQTRGGSLAVDHQAGTQSDSIIYGCAGCYDNHHNHQNHHHQHRNDHTDDHHDDDDDDTDDYFDYFALDDGADSILSSDASSSCLRLQCTKCLSVSKRPTEIQPKKYACKQCKTIQRCAFCRTRVMGIFVCCPDCKHGGHLHHMRKWFSVKSYCPAGCGHKCTPYVP